MTEHAALTPELNKIRAGLKGRTALFLRGFNPAQIEAILGLSPADTAALLRAGADASALAGGADVVFGLYEEFILLTDAGADLCGRAAVVIEAPAQEDGFPSPLPEEDAAALAAFLASDAPAPDEKLGALARVYAACERGEEGAFFVRPFDRHTGTEVRTLTLPGGTAGAQGFESALAPGSARADGAFLAPLFRRHWGEEAAFRMLKFYRDPASGLETEEISQGEIMAAVVRESEAALRGEAARDIFVTAPTGAGKSLLFQLPALHLKERFGAVTVVISPLIALMKDQAEGLERERGIADATFLNSSIPYDERMARMRAIHAGEKSIVYLAPEMLLATSLQNILGPRPLGLFVVDEAHIVTSWGRDFRSDYWYLGDFLTRERRGGRRFPVLCLTATAVCGGPDDVVADTVRTLRLRRALVYLGSVRRENIGFDIRAYAPEEVEGATEAFKRAKAAERIEGFVERHEKSILYCPYTSQAGEIHAALSAHARARTGVYHAKLGRLERAAAQEKFKYGALDVMICTKAFGMGVDVSNIQNIYHYAPTGNLADYVQEIGRAARQADIAGRAVCDYLPTDLNYMRVLYGLSGMRQYQLREMLRKTQEACRRRERGRFLLSPEAFSYLFDERDLENRVKNGMLLLAKDLEERFGYPVMTVRPKAMFTENYINLPERIEKAFLRAFGAFVTRVEDHTRRVISSENKRFASDTVVTNSGSIYRIDMNALWQERFETMTLADFKRRFYDGELFDLGHDVRVAPRVRIAVSYRFPFEETQRRLSACISAMTDVFRRYRTENRTFTVEEFESDLREALADESGRAEFAKLLMELFLTDAAQNMSMRRPPDRTKFIQARRLPDGGGVGYRVTNANYLSLDAHFRQLLSQSVPGEDNVFDAYIAVASGGRKQEKMRLLSILELFGLASYEVTGGRSVEIFVAANDEKALLSLDARAYENRLLTDIDRRRTAAQELMDRFLTAELPDGVRWDVIEEYFLGRSESVNKALICAKRGSCGTAGS